MNLSEADRDELQIRGPQVAAYSSDLQSFAFPGISLQAVARDYVISFTLQIGVDPITSNSSQNIRVPRCSDGESHFLNGTSCFKCRGGTVAFSRDDSPSDLCLPCPSGGRCSGGGVLVPASLYWHSSPRSTALHKCPNPEACSREDSEVQKLQDCQRAW